MTQKDFVNFPSLYNRLTKLTKSSPVCQTIDKAGGGRVRTKRTPTPPAWYYTIVSRLCQPPLTKPTKLTKSETTLFSWQKVAPEPRGPSEQTAGEL